MDLIYMNEKHEDVGVLSGYLLDLAYGKDENNFECTVDIDNHVCREKYMLYIDGTEYGGIIDVISPDTDKKEIVYSGRTWHGVLEKKIIYPDPGYEYFEVAGDANKILEELIIRLNLNDIFAVEESESDIDIPLYQFVHVQAYSGIRDMLAQYDGKLRMKWTGNKIVLSAVPIIDYSQDEQFDSNKPVRERFTRRTNVREGFYHKNFIQVNRIDRMIMHYAFYDPDKHMLFENEKGNQDLFAIDHYYTKSWEEWQEKIKVRGGADPNYHKALREFFIYNPDMVYLDTGEQAYQKYEGM